MALGDKVEELQRNVATLIERLDNVRKVVDRQEESVAALSRELAKLRSEFEKETALLRRELDDHKKWREETKKERDEQSRRLWAFGPNVVGALISGIIAAIVAYFISRP